MNKLKLLSKRLAMVENLTLFAKRHRIAYRTLQRMKSGHDGRDGPTLKTFDAITKALDKDSIIGGVK